MLAFGDLCSGGGGASLGAIAAGLTPVFAVEHDPDIAACYRRNVGAHVIVGDVAAVDIAALPRVDILWFSPPCQQHSVARSKSLAPRADGDLALCILDYARVLRPAVIVMENVPPWRKSAVYRVVVSGLSALGYFVDGQLVDASLHGVPQTRRRCVVRAVLGGLVPALPAPGRRIGWYAALADLLPGLPDSAFAPWQLERLSGLHQSALVTEQFGRPMAVQDREPQCLTADKPAVTVANQHGKWRAFLAHPTADNDYFPAPFGDDPAFTITGTHGMPRAFLQMTGNTQTAHPTGTGVLSPETPANTVTLGSGDARAWLSQGRVVALSPRCLARLQTFPDSYELPASKALAGRIVGNAVPPELARRILAGLRHCIQDQAKEIA